MTKYHARGIWIDDIYFPSRMEGKRYEQLKLMQQAGEIKALSCHPCFILQPESKDPATGEKIKSLSYEGDFRYADTRTGKDICEEVKGYETALFKAKWKLVRVMYPNVEFRLLKSDDIGNW